MAINRMKAIQEAMRDPEEAPYVGGLGAIKAAKLLKEAQRPAIYTPRSLAQAASQARLPVPERQRQQVPVPQGYRQQVPVPVPERRQAITDEGERILTAQAGGRAAIPQQIENVASKGRHGDTMLMHVNPDELRGLSSLLGPTTTNPDTGLPEAFAWWLPLIGAAIGGIGAAATGHDWKKGLLFGGLAGLGAGFAAPAMGLTGAPAAALAPTAGMAGTSTLAPAVGLSTAAGGAFGPMVQPMATAGAGALQSAIPGIAAATQATVPTLSTTAAQGLQTVLSPEELLAQGGARNVPTNWFKRNLMQPLRFGLQGERGITPSVIDPLTGQSTLHRTPDTLAGSEAATAEGGAGSDMFGGIKNWFESPIEKFKEQGPLTRAGIVGAGAAGIGSLLSKQPPQQQFAELPTREVSEFTFEDKDIEKDPRVSRTFTEEELREAVETGPVPSFFANEGGLVNLAIGGVPNVFAGHVQGVGDGMSDQIPFRVVPRTPEDIPKAPDMAVLSTDEYVFPADAVSMLGNGSSDAGAKILDNAVKSVRQASIGTPKQITEIDGAKVLGGALTT
jgi:hypothetical protein